MQLFFVSQFDLFDLGDKSGASDVKFMHWRTSILLISLLLIWIFHWLLEMGHLGPFFVTTYSALQMFPFSSIYSCHFTSSSSCTDSEIIIYTHDLLSLQSYWIAMLFYSCSGILNQSLSHLRSRPGGQPGIFTSRLSPSHISWPVHWHSFITANL